MTGAKGLPLRKWRTFQLAIVQHDISPRALLLLSRLIHHHNDRTGLSNPGEETLAAALNCSTRAIRKCLRELEREGPIKDPKGSRMPTKELLRDHLVLGHEGKVLCGGKNGCAAPEKNFR